MDTTAVNQAPDQPKPWVRRALCSLGYLAVALLLFLATAWGAAALWIDMPNPWLRGPLLVVYLLGLLAVWVFVKNRRRAAGLTAVTFALVLGWWFTLKPSNARDWQPDLAVLPYAQIEGNKVHLHNIRNCDYRSETDFDVRHYERDFDLDTLRTAELFMVYWGSPYMAHTMVSFGFDNGDYVCFSIETRKEIGEGYSAIKGLFRQFELMYVVADERDVVRLRTNYRQGEEVYLYRLHGSREQFRKLFLDYVHRVNSLRDQPEWYNALTDNCTTAIRTQRAAADRAPWDWRMLVNGYGDRLLYERGVITTNLPFPELKQQSHINSRARTAANDAEFSRVIRQSLPK